MVTLTLQEVDIIMAADEKLLETIDQEANKRILELVKPEYMKRIPFFARKHATGSTCELIAKEYPEIYKLAKSEETFTQEVQERIGTIINGIFEKKMQKHGFQSYKDSHGKHKKFITGRTKQQD